MISSGLGQSIQCCPADISKQERCGSDLQIRTNWRVILRLVVSNLMSRQRPVTSGIPQLLALGLIPFNSFVVTWIWIWVHPQQICRQYHSAWCGRHNEGKGCHRKSPGQAWEVGPCKHNEVHQDQAQCPAVGLWQSQTLIQARQRMDSEQTWELYRVLADEKSVVGNTPAVQKASHIMGCYKRGGQQGDGCDCLLLSALTRCHLKYQGHEHIGTGVEEGHEDHQRTGALLMKIGWQLGLFHLEKRRF